MKNTSWDLSHIYPDESAFSKDLSHFKDDIIPSMASYEGKLGEEKSLAEFLGLEKELSMTLSRLYMYAASISDLDKKDVKAGERLSKVELAANDGMSKISFADPEILQLGEEKVKAFFKSRPELSEFDFGYAKLFRSQKHVLSGDKEKLLSYYSPLLDEGSKMYSLLSVADYVPKKVTLYNGETKEVNMSNWISLIQASEKPEDRAKIFETLYSYYDAHKNAYGEIYNAVLNSELSEMKSRGYSSILQEHLFNNKIPESVFLSLIKEAKEGSAPLKKYYEVRRKYLGLEKHRSYDRFIQLAKSDKKYTYDEARELFFSSIKDFPEDFQKKAHEVSSEGYVDVYPHPGKRTGAYSNGGEGIHPYILLNFEGELEDCFTLAHESGHSIHTLYSEESQPIMKQDYTIFVAEIASTFNEHNLLDYLLNSGKLSKNEQIALLQKAIDQICSTFYRQTLFADYEYQISLLAEKGEAINYEVLSKTMVSLYKDYYGIDISEEKVKPLVWAYIPHLYYTPFYVYQYATSFTASMIIYEKVKNKEPQAFENYIKLLRSGGSDFPIEEVKAAGVDLTDEKSFASVTKRMSELVDKLETLLK
ncbi:MAG: oligoendopeptidase F [Bacilli bacterium]|jgi:oligoendopeptidase F|nr:oligoendopeptidase F [Bacilli bacterium]MCH4210249.1 oligoendopeptidase F [Bacilli bacterium]MCH4228431.1 oligoendopeptidase F [Bacilli bacterium]MCH4277300.1 oligoendopeptidase F [Bacilli bacterium]MCI2055352.1 oligoendopeptidase F [Bacilli bacterium]